MTRRPVSAYTLANACYSEPPRMQCEKWASLTSVMCQSRERSNDSALLSTTGRRARDEDAGIFAPVSTGTPLASGRVPEGLPLSWEVTITGGNAEQECIVALESLGIGDWNIGLGRSVHLEIMLV